MSSHYPSAKRAKETRKKVRSKRKSATALSRAIIDSISFSISRDFRRHYRREDRLRTLDSSLGAFSIHFPYNPFTMSIETALVRKGGTHAAWFSRKRLRNMIIMAKSQAKTENKMEENMKVAQSKLSSIAEQSITTNGQY